LKDHDNEKEINLAFAGEHFYNGCIRGDRNDKTKGNIGNRFERLNEGEELAESEVDRVLSDYLA